MTTSPSIAFIGAGNMASSIIGGLIQSGIPQQSLSASDPNEANRNKVASQFGIHTTANNDDIARDADVVILAVKPQIMESVCTPLAGTISSETLVLSIAAGVTCTQLEQWLSSEQPVVRCMPNTPALVGLAASGLYANAHVSDTQKTHAETILNAVGISCWVEKEDLIDAVTAVSGSSPAYFFLFIEAMIDAAACLGLDNQTATTLALQSALGASTLAHTSDDDIVTLRQKVTSPKGTTEQAIGVFENNDLRGCVKEAMAACVQRAKELAS